LKRAVFALALAATVGGAGFALRQQALWAVTRACVADFSATGAAFPCLAVEADAVLIRPFWTPDLILVPTRKLIGVEDPFLQSPEAPPYFAAAWAARASLRSAEWEDVALVVNPAVARSQAQLHIHIGCLRPAIREALARVGPQAPTDAWAPLPEIVPHIVFWGRRVAKADLDGVAPFREAAQALADRAPDRARLTIAVAGLRVEGARQFLLLASYAGAPHSWWPVSAENMVDTRCGPRLSADSRYDPANSAPAAARP